MIILILGETKKINMYQAVNEALAIALEKDPNSGKQIYLFFSNNSFFCQ